ncbi:aminotransferase class I/II-fold pyridoxal phosphate-dependent enzyme [Herbidospora sp. NEAU-GS84]|uniref:Aminotransferase class I/II-fold pyridoxal phosphate-dependent enzyme n=1 Tax=Herbidospora solisilvae TaxID=2696284 RepID=A0A7C9J7I4_9ACTN|nr:PLP-dependent aminotransferase family protein [Herbidospora solisilvae]NAS25960.1 aminotransferase class I/II-fold pyridoxal phosphate-dependent enzyme [Herbidospora solisilvae]
MLDRHAAANLQTQIVNQIRAAIQNEVLCAGDRMPSTRLFADALRVSRSVIVAAYQELQVHGLIEARHGAGTYVTHALRRSSVTAPASRSPAPRRRPSRPVIADLTPGQTRMDTFPTRAWRAAWRNASYQVDVPWDACPRGGILVRKALARHLRRLRGLTCTPEQIVLTRSVPHAIGLLADAVAVRDRTVVVEDPCAPEVRWAMRDRRGRITAAPVDHDGLIAAGLPGEAALAIVSPSHQFPTGAVMSLRRRRELSAWAAESGALLIEDDSGCEFQRPGLPLPAMFMQTDRADIAYVGSFSGIFGSAVQLGYIVARGRLPERIEHALTMAGERPQALLEAAMVQLLDGNDLIRHINRTSRAHHERRRLLRQHADRSPVLGTVSGDTGGSHALLHLPSGISATDLAHRLHDRGVIVAALAAYCADPASARQCLVIGHGHLDPGTLAHAMDIIEAEVAGAARPRSASALPQDDRLDRTARGHVLSDRDLLRPDEFAPAGHRDTLLAQFEQLGRHRRTEARTQTDLLVHRQPPSHGRAPNAGRA